MNARSHWKQAQDVKWNEESNKFTNSRNVI